VNARIREIKEGYWLLVESPKTLVSISVKGKRLFSFLKHSDWLWGSPTPSV
jgi:hypothetical protein